MHRIASVELLMMVMMWRLAFMALVIFPMFLIARIRCFTAWLEACR